jgi:hypothetical protein
MKAPPDIPWPTRRPIAVLASGAIKAIVDEAVAGTGFIAESPIIGYLPQGQARWRSPAVGPIGARAESPADDDHGELAPASPVRPSARPAVLVEGYRRRGGRGTVGRAPYGYLAESLKERFPEALTCPLAGDRPPLARSRRGLRRQQTRSTGAVAGICWPPRRPVRRAQGRS